MRRLVRIAEVSQGILLFAGLVLPLALFFFKVAPWRLDLSAFFGQASIQAAIANTLILATVTAISSTLIGFVLSWLLWRYEWPRRLARVVAILLKLPYLMPPFFFAMGWIVLAAPEVGYLNRILLKLGLSQLPSIYGLGGSILILTLWSTALAMIQLQVFFTQVPGSLEDAAIVSGASPLRALTRITLPLAKPQLISCALLSFISAIAAFGVPAMLGSPARTYVLTTRIYQEIKTGQDFSKAGLLGLLLLGITLLTLVIQRAFLSQSRKLILVSGKATRPASLKPGRSAKILFGLTAAYAVFSCALPSAALALQSFLRDRADLGSLTLEKYVYVFGQIPDGLNALKNSLITSVVAALAATALGLCLAYGASRLKLKPSRFLSEAWNIGYSLPGTLIALSLLVFYSGSLSDTLGILILAYFVKYAAFALRTLNPAISALSLELEEAAWMSGAAPITAFFRIVVPLLVPALAAAATLAFVPMLSELTMSILLTGTGTETLGALIYRLQEYADPGSAAVLAVVTTGSILILNTFLRRISRGGFGV